MRGQRKRTRVDYCDDDSDDDCEKKGKGKRARQLKKNKPRDQAVGAVACGDGVLSAALFFELAQGSFNSSPFVRSTSVDDLLVVLESGSNNDPKYALNSNCKQPGVVRLAEMILGYWNEKCDRGVQQNWINMEIEAFHSLIAPRSVAQGLADSVAVFRRLREEYESRQGQYYKDERITAALCKWVVRQMTTVEPCSCSSNAKANKVDNNIHRFFHYLMLCGVPGGTLHGLMVWALANAPVSWVKKGFNELKKVEHKSEKAQVKSSGEATRMVAEHTKSMYEKYSMRAVRYSSLCILNDLYLCWDSVGPSEKEVVAMAFCNVFVVSSLVKNFRTVFRYTLDIHRFPREDSSASRLFDFLIKFVDFLNNRRPGEREIDALARQAVVSSIPCDIFRLRCAVPQTDGLCEPTEIDFSVPLAGGLSEAVVVDDAAVSPCVSSSLFAGIVDCADDLIDKEIIDLFTAEDLEEQEGGSLDPR